MFDLCWTNCFHPHSWIGFISSTNCMYECLHVCMYVCMYVCQWVNASGLRHRDAARRWDIDWVKATVTGTRKNLWNLLSSLDPSQENAKESSDKVKFSWGICPVKQVDITLPRHGTKPGESHQSWLSLGGTSFSPRHWRLGTSRRSSARFVCRFWYKSVESLLRLMRLQCPMQDPCGLFRADKTTRRSRLSWCFDNAVWTHTKPETREFDSRWTYQRWEMRAPWSSRTWRGHARGCPGQAGRQSYRSGSVWPLRPSPKSKGKVKKGKEFWKAQRSTLQRCASM